MEISSANVRIAWAKPDEVEEIIPLLQALYKHDVPEADQPSLDVVKAHFGLLVEPSTPHRLAIAWKNEGLAVGLAAVATFISVSDPRPQHWKQAELKELFVLPEFRGQMIGAKLLDWIEEYAVAAKACRMDWHVKSENLRGISFYESRGASVVANRISMRKRFSS